MRWSEEQAERWEALADELRRRLGPGTPVPSAERAGLQARLGADLSSPMLHRGSLPGMLARGVGGQSISIGEHVLGEATDLDTGTARGAALLGHELVHAAIQHHPAVVVQRASAGSEVVPDRDEEAVAQQVEAALLRDEEHIQAPRSPAEIDAEALADRVYRRLLDELLLETERAARLA
jgi:hypothetical protein